MNADPRTSTTFTPGQSVKLDPKTGYNFTGTIVRYHRGGNWVVREPDHNTTVHVQEDLLSPA